MSSLDRELEVVDLEGNTVRHELRRVIHEEGLLHKEVHVWVVNDKKQVLLQKRAEDKDTFPGAYDVSAGGHVEIGDDFLSSALKEFVEETGILAHESEISFLEAYHHTTHDTGTNLINHVLRSIYVYQFQPERDQYREEKGRADFLEWWNIGDLLRLSDYERAKYVWAVLIDENVKILEKIRNM